MTRREENVGLGGGIFGPVIMAATGILIFVILVVFAPTIASAVQDAQPDLSPTSDWNASANEDLPNAAAQWTQGITILGVCILLISVSLAFAYMRGML